MFGSVRRLLAREIDFRVAVRALAAAVVLAVAAIIAYVGSTSRHRNDLEIATSILVIGVLAYGIYAALTAEPPERDE